jgi:UDP-N-acetylglucosamine 4,6-dehydratase/5-epimerase
MRSVLVTGGTGTFGKRFVEHCMKSGLYERIVIFSRDEFKQYNFRKRLISKFGDAADEKVRFFLGDIRDKERLKTAFVGIDDVVHAAALKHVPLCEYNPSEAVKTNVYGTQNVCDVAIECHVENVVVLSTDKAVEPINFYGSTKMLAEKYAIFSNSYSRTSEDSHKKTKISCVRYGNVVGSRGSIVEAFLSMPKEKPFTITDENMTRFWMHIEDSVNMVLWTLKNMLGGEIVIPKLKCSTVTDIARAIDEKRELKIIGIRPGEKIHEQLFSRREHERAYDKKDYIVIVPESESWMLPGQMQEIAEKYKKSDRVSYYSNDSDLVMTLEEVRENIINRIKNDQGFQ